MLTNGLVQGSYSFVFDVKVLYQIAFSNKYRSTVGPQPSTPRKR